MDNVRKNLADDWIRITDLWHRKQLLYPLRHYRGPTSIKVFLAQLFAQSQVTFVIGAREQIKKLVSSSGSKKVSSEVQVSSFPRSPEISAISAPAQNKNSKFSASE